MNNAQLNALASIAQTTTKAETLLVAIATLVKAGFEIEAAFEVVVGKGSYQKFAGQIYDSLRAK